MPRAYTRKPEEKACMKLRDLLLPACPTIKVKGKLNKVLPVCFIQFSVNQAEPIIVYALPPGSKPIAVPSEIQGFQTHKKVWEGGAPKEIQDLALKAFGAKK